MTTRWPRASSACTKPRSSTTWGHGKPPPGSRPPPANGPAGTTPRGSCGAPGAARRANTSRPGATAHSARSPPAARAAGPAGHQKEAAMAAAHYPGGLRPHPPGLRPGPRPSSEMPRQVKTGAAAGGYLLAGRIEGCHGTPAQVKGASGVAGDDAEASPLTSPGNPRRNAGARRGDAQAPRGGLAGAARHQAGQLDSAVGQMFDKTKRKNDQTVVPPGGGTVEDNGPPRQEHLGRIESPPNSGCSRGCRGMVSRSFH
jgi:hypothetical protein